MLKMVTGPKKSETFVKPNKSRYCVAPSIQFSTACEKTCRMKRVAEIVERKALNSIRGHSKKTLPFLRLRVYFDIYCFLICVV